MLHFLAKSVIRNNNNSSNRKAELKCLVNIYNLQCLLNVDNKVIMCQHDSFGETSRAGAVGQLAKVLLVINVQGFRARQPVVLHQVPEWETSFCCAKCNNFLKAFVNNSLYNANNDTY